MNPNQSTGNRLEPAKHRQGTMQEELNDFRDVRRLSQGGSSYNSSTPQQRQPTHGNATFSDMEAMPRVVAAGPTDFSPTSVDGATPLRSPPGQSFISAAPSIELYPPHEERVFPRECVSPSLESLNPLDAAKSDSGSKPVRGDVYESPQDVEEFDVYERAKKRDKPNMTSYENAESTSCCMQLGHTMLRVLVLMRREMVSTICELVIPIIFVIGSVILWAIFGTSKQPVGLYYDPSSLTQFSTAMMFIRSNLCLAPGGEAIPNVAACATDATYYCPTGRGVPTGLCYNASAQVPGTNITMQQTVLGINTFFQESTMAAPTFDDIVLLHWLNMDERYASKVADSSSLAAGGTLFFAPDTAEVSQLVDYMRSNSDYFDLVYGQTFATVKDAETFVTGTTTKDPPNWGIVQVNSMSTNSFDVSIRLNSSSVPGSGSTTDKWYIGGLSAGTNDLYLSSGFATLQTAVYDFYLTQIQGVSATVPPLTYTPMPTAELNSKDFVAYGGQFAPLILVLGFLYPVSQLTRRIVVEKELRIREAMLIMGLSEAIMYLAWFLIYGAWYVVLSLICAIILRFTYFVETNFGYTFFMFLFFSWSTITLSGLLASFFSKARLSAILAPLIYFVLAIPLFAMQSAPPGAKIGVSILSPSAFALCCTLIFEHEASGGARAADLNTKQDNPTLLICFVFLFCDIFVYLLLMMYFDCIIPKQWGTTKNPLFCIIDPIKWCCCRGKDDEDDEDNLLEDGRAADGVFEKEFDEDQATVKILGLRKKFKRGGKSFLAVNNLYWSLRQGEISVLLGHNGAGKSTTMNIMTGMLEADGGDCIIYGNSIRTQLTAARQEIGLCPQHNILWPMMTVEEHLTYFSAIKGLRGTRRENAVSRMLAGVDLEDKRHYRSDALSGGQKRKLSVAIAFVGGSRLIFLDEPTAGMDVGARRHTWGLVRDMADDHTILLTTHFMDEADLLGSSVAIMSQGRLQCSGSNMFLKAKLGGGFVMTMSVIAHVNRKNIEKLVRQHVQAAEPMGTGAGEVAYRLPQTSKSVFPALLSAVEEQSPALGINAYSLSATTLEEVFLRIAEKDLKGEDLDEEETAQATSAVWNVNLIEKRSSLLWSQFCAMMVKRFWNAIRDARTVFFQIICPVACVLLAMLLTLVKFFNYPTLTLSGNIYDTTVDFPIAHCANTLLNSTTPFAPDTVMEQWTDIDTGTAFQDKLLSTYFGHANDRYSGLICTPTDMSTFSALFYNNSALHEIPMQTRNYYNAILQQVKSGTAPQLVTKAEVMPKTKQEGAVQDSIYSMMIAVIIMIPFSFIPSTYVAWIVKERECKARHLQNVSGLSFYIYWLTNFLFDLCCYLVTMFLVIAIFGIFSRKEYISKDNIGATIVLFLLYGISGILMAYSLSFLFNSHSTAQNVVMLANFIVGFLLVLAISSLRIIESTQNVANVLRWIFRIVPSYDVGEGIANLATLQVMQAFGFGDTAWSMNSGVGWPCVYMAIEIPLFLFITLFIDHPGRRQRSQRLLHNPDATPEVIEDQDPDVIIEADAVDKDADRANDLVSVRALRKVYANGKVAVRNITFGVKPGEVFGFLGTNGAGKTTTISILCQEFYPTSGHAAVCGNDIVNQSEAALRCIGYCPQFDACLDLLTVEEHLQMYAGVRGITKETRDQVVQGLMKLCELTTYRKTKSLELSGGNRRKLSVAISLIGGPRVVFLDEPSAGMDPVARRGLWTAIETVADNCSIVLTTHHLEEVEALAHRVAIMVDGALHCIGDKTHLKQKFGTGYEVTVRVHADDKDTLAAVEQFFQNSFASPELVEVRATRITYQVPKDRPLSAVFALLEDSRRRLGITDYNISQTSIEQVFLRISEEAEAKEEEERLQHLGDKKKCCCCCC